MPGGAILQWGFSKYTSSSEFGSTILSVRKIPFAKNYQDPPIVVFKHKWNSAKTENAYTLTTSDAGEGTGTAISTSYFCAGCATGMSLYWIAIGI